MTVRDLRPLDAHRLTDEGAARRWGSAGDPVRGGGAPRAVHPWPEDEPELVARAIALGAVLSLGAWTLAAVVVLLVLAVLT